MLPLPVFAGLVPCYHYQCLQVSFHAPSICRCRQISDIKQSVINCYVIKPKQMYNVSFEGGMDKGEKKNEGMMV